MKIQLSRYKTNAIQGQRRLSTYYPNAFDNLFSNYLNSLYNNSPTHQCIIDDLAQQIVGLGLTCDDKEKDAKLQEFFKKKNLLSIASGLLVQESISLEIRRNPLMEIKAVENINVAHFRVVELEDGYPIRFSYKEDWNPKSPIYNYKNNYINSYNNEEAKSLLYYYDSGTFNTPYGRPKYLSAADAIELEIAIYMMHNHGAQNGMFPSMIISKETSGDAEIDKQDSVETQHQTTGAANAGKVITTFYRQGGNAPTFSTPNLTGIDKIYENQYETAEIGILKAHRIPSANLISGLNSKGAGFTSETEELAFATERMMEKIVIPRREQILEILSPIFSELECEDVRFKEVKEEAVVSVIDMPTSEGIEPQGNETQAELDLIAKDKEASYNGAQISSALGIMTNVNEGILTVDQAKAFLVQMLQFTPELAESLFPEGEQPRTTHTMPDGSVMDGETHPEEDLKETTEVNESLKNLTGRQMQGIERIVRKYGKGQLTEAQAKLMLKAGYGFSEEDASVWLTNEENLSKKKDFNDEQMLDALAGEKINFNDWELVDTREANGESIEDWANSLIKAKKSSIERLADFIKSAPNKESRLDKDYYKVRYTYQQKYSSNNSRQFCKSMMGRTGNGVVYRLEDIDKASEDGVNNQFGHNGQNYSLFRYKGGVQCGHFWQEELYRFKSKTEKYLSRGKEVDNIPSKYKPKRTSAQRDAKKAPRDMKDGGAYPK
ncbi:hypothetical protein N9515_10035 [Vicingaceae bacterium]|nr:hypothetical protein [Vicingaceae bacterium]